MPKHEDKSFGCQTLSSPRYGGGGVRAQTGARGENSDIDSHEYISLRTNRDAESNVCFDVSQADSMVDSP